MSFTNAFLDDLPPVSISCEDDEHEWCNSVVKDRKTGEEIAKCHCYCHKVKNEPED